MPPGPFYRQDDIGGVQKIVDDRTPHTEAQGTVIVVDPTAVWAQINGSSNAVVVDLMNGIVVKPNDKVALRRLPGSQRWSVYAVQTANGTVGNNNSSPSASGGTVPVAAPDVPVVTPTYGALVIYWSPPGSSSDALFELELADTASGTGAVIYKVAGSVYVHFGSTIKYARVRGLGADFTRSGWTAQVSGTPINFLETLQDDVATMLIAGSNITLTYNDTLGTLTIEGAAPAITVQEDDLSPSVNPTNTIIFPTGSLTDDRGGVVRVNFPTGGDVATIKKTIETRTVIYDETLAVDGPIDITGIPAGYDRLEFVAQMRTVSAASGIEELFMFFNNDTTQANYAWTQLYSHANGGVGGGSGASNDIGHVFQNGVNVLYPMPIRGHIDQYANASLYKLTFTETLTSDNYIMFRQNRWNNTAVINRISLSSSTSGNSFKAGSRFQLIGIKTEQVVTAVSGDGTMVLATTKAEIDTYTRLGVHDLLVDTAGPLTFSVIDQAYDHLELRMSVRSTYAGPSSIMYLSLNGDTTDANYLRLEAYSGPTGTAGGAANDRRLETIPAATASSGNWQPMTGRINYYAYTDRYKESEWVFSLLRPGDNYRINQFQQWINTAAITSIAFTLDAGDFKAGSVIELWGIKRKEVVTDITGDLTATVKEYETSFDYATSNPLALHTAGTNEKIIECKIIIDTAFDDATTLHVGEMGGTSRLMASADNDPLSIGVSVNEPEYVYSGGEIINLYITTIATMGAGRVCLITKG